MVDRPCITVPVALIVMGICFAWIIGTKKPKNNRMARILWLVFGWLGVGAVVAGGIIHISENHCRCWGCQRPKCASCIDWKIPDGKIKVILADFEREEPKVFSEMLAGKLEDTWRGDSTIQFRSVGFIGKEEGGRSQVERCMRDSCMCCGIFIWGYRFKDEQYKLNLLFEAPRTKGDTTIVRRKDNPFLEDLDLLGEEVACAVGILVASTKAYSGEFAKSNLILQEVSGCFAESRLNALALGKIGDNYFDLAEYDQAFYYYSEAELSDPLNSAYSENKKLAQSLGNDTSNASSRITPRIKVNDSVYQLGDQQETQKYFSGAERRDSTDNKFEVAIQEIIDNMVLVKGGAFEMGCTTEQGKDCSGTDHKHSVVLGNYYIGRYEVTQLQWLAVMGSKPSGHKNCDNCPVENVSWNDIQLFIQKLRKMTKFKFRLPTEAEWEFAARGGKRSKGYKFAGSNRLGEVAWYTENSQDSHPVGEKLANELGLFDMSGNIWELCQDWYDFNYYVISPEKNPSGPKYGQRRSLRGGCFNLAKTGCRVSARDFQGPDSPDYMIGFRLAVQ